MTRGFRRTTTAAAAASLVAILTTACGPDSQPVAHAPASAATVATQPAARGASTPTRAHAAAAPSAGVATPPAAGPRASSPRPVTIEQVLERAQVPAYCQMPAQTLLAATSSASLHPKEGWLSTSGPGAPITASFGTMQRFVVAEYTCTAGGVSWPSVLVVYGPGNRLVDWVTLANVDQAEHALVTKWSSGGGGVDVRWTAHEGASFEKRFHSSRITLTDGRAVLTETAPVVTEERAAADVVNAFLSAAVSGDTATMRRQAAPEAYAAFQARRSGSWSRPSGCVVEVSDATPSCQISIVSNGTGLASSFGFEMAVSIDGRATITDIRPDADAH